MSPLIHLKREAQRARQALSKLETQAWTMRELGESWPDDFRAAFSAAATSVRLAELAVTKEQEAESKRA